MKHACSRGYRNSRQNRASSNTRSPPTSPTFTRRDFLPRAGIGLGTVSLAGLPSDPRVLADAANARHVHRNSHHDPAMLLLTSGVMQPTRPCFGSGMLHGRGGEIQNPPGFIALFPGRSGVVGPQFWNNHFLLLGQ